MGITADTYEALGLRKEEYEKILDILGREPSATELAMFSCEWSEHCGYPRSRPLLKRFPKKGPYDILIGEDSGGFIVDDMAIVFKMESHNHPSQVEPKQGAATGVGGIIRDIFTAGTRPIASLNSLRFGSLDEAYNRYLLGGVVDGIQFYGNCIGVPTIGGEIYFEDAYSGNCLVNAMSIGLAKKKDLARARAEGVGNLIMYVGAATGRDGIGGCSVLASNEFQEGEEKRPTVQIGDPFMEKCLIEATLETLQTGYVVGIKDMGAAGLTCCTSEMAAAGSSGMEVELKEVPLRETNMEPWEIMMSESQERMLVCITKEGVNAIKKIFDKWGLNAAVIGQVTGDGKVRIKNNGEIVADINAKDLVEAPTYDMPSEEPSNIKELQALDLDDVKEPTDYEETFLKILTSPNIASKKWVYEQYDHMVQTNTVVLPGSDAAVIRIKGTKKALAATTDCNGRYCYLNPHRGAMIAISEAARNLICSGARPAAVTDCLNFGNPEKPDRFWYFKNCIDGIVDACEHYTLPVISGNVSFYNENPKGAIYPTPTIGMVGVIDDVDKVCTQYFKNEGDTIILLGQSKDEIGGSEYLKVIHGLVKGNAPEIDLKTESNLWKLMGDLTDKQIIQSAHDLSEGGLAVALAEAAFSPSETPVGFEVDLTDYTIRLDSLLFGETQSRILISCSKDKLSEVINLADQHGVKATDLGCVGGDRMIIRNHNAPLIDLPSTDVRDKWEEALENLIKRKEA